MQCVISKLLIKKKIVNKGYISCFHPQYAMCDTKTYDLKVTRFICVFDILFEY